MQTRRFLDTLQSYLFEIQNILIQNWKENNQASDSTYVDHTGTLRDSKTNKAIEERLMEGKEDAEDSMRQYKHPPGDMWQFADFSISSRAVSGFGFYDAGIDAVKTHRSRKHAVGESPHNLRSSRKRDYANEWDSCQAEHLHLLIIRFGISLESVGNTSHASVIVQAV